MVRVFSDSTCDLPKELQEKYHVTIVPLFIVMNGEEHRDGIDITPEQIFAWSDANKTTPKTAASSITDTMAAMKPVLDQGDDIVIFCISESMSATGGVFRMAAEELGASDRVSVINSQNLSSGISLLVIEAALMAEAGMSRVEITARINELIPMVRSSFVVDTLTFLHRGGRCSSVAALAGGALKLHPKIEVKGGAMGAGKKYRGKIDGVIMKYIEDMKDELLKAKPDRVFITYSSCTPETLEAVRNYLKALDVFKEILEARAGGVISSHCGPGTLGVLFIAGE